VHPNSPQIEAGGGYAITGNDSIAACSQWFCCVRKNAKMSLLKCSAQQALENAEREL